MGKNFCDLSNRAQDVVVNTILGVQGGKLSRSVREEILQWGTPWTSEDIGKDPRCKCGGEPDGIHDCPWGQCFGCDLNCTCCPECTTVCLTNI